MEHHGEHHPLPGLSPWPHAGRIMLLAILVVLSLMLLIGCADGVSGGGETRTESDLTSMADATHDGHQGEAPPPAGELSQGSPLLDDAGDRRLARLIKHLKTG